MNIQSALSPLDITDSDASIITTYIEQTFQAAGYQINFILNIETFIAEFLPTSASATSDIIAKICNSPIHLTNQSRFNLH